ncbi:hypothetical protein BDZ91DRAFT_789337 [Kalaharituber pfeilii]|nr:hypothetical protein BDZ91DRAFT_789337 [Kalaharituber pfeilii]
MRWDRSALRKELRGRERAKETPQEAQVVMEIPVVSWLTRTQAREHRLIVVVAGIAKQRNSTIKSTIPNGIYNPAGGRAMQEPAATFPIPRVNGKGAKGPSMNHQLPPPKMLLQISRDATSGAFEVAVGPPRVNEFLGTPEVWIAFVAHFALQPSCYPRPSPQSELCHAPSTPKPDALPVGTEGAVAAWAPHPSCVAELSDQGDSLQAWDLD